MESLIDAWLLLVKTNFPRKMIHFFYKARCETYDGDFGGKEVTWESARSSETYPQPHPESHSAETQEAEGSGHP